jgi:hypothetical protein
MVDIIRYGQLTFELDQQVDLTWAHRSLCVAGLPVRRPQETDRNSVNDYTRRGSGFTLRLETHPIDIPNMNTSVPVGIPFGAKARLLILWMASLAYERQSSSDRYLEIGPVKQWLQQVGASTGGEQINATKEQLIKLCHTSFHITVRTDLDGEDTVFFRHENFVEAGAIGIDDLLAYKKGDMEKVRWPSGIVLTESAWKRFGRDLVPVPATRLRKVAHSPTAIDLFLYLSYRLPLISRGDTQMLTWRQLTDQFAPKKVQPSVFRNNLGSAIRDALAAYPEAKIDVTDEGLVLHHSDPAELRKAFFSVWSGGSTHGKVRNRYKVRASHM